MVYDGYGALKTNFSNNDDLTFIVVPSPTTRGPIHTEFVSSSIHCTEISKHIFPEMKLRGLRTLYESKNTFKKSGQTKNVTREEMLYLFLYRVFNKGTLYHSADVVSIS
jgi:hypothetical protein